MVLNAKYGTKLTEKSFAIVYMLLNYYIFAVNVTFCIIHTNKFDRGD